VHASSRVSRYAAERRPGCSFEVDVGERLPVGVADDEAGVGFLDGPGQRRGLTAKPESVRKGTGEHHAPPPGQHEGKFNVSASLIYA
jgi:hypothetical protein